MKLRSFMGLLAFAIIMFIPSQSLAKGSYDKGSSCHKSYSKKGSHASRHLHKKGSRYNNKKKYTHKSWCKHSKGAKDSSNKGSNNKWLWSKGSSDKGSKESYDKGSSCHKSYSKKGSHTSRHLHKKGSNCNQKKQHSFKSWCHTSKGSNDKTSYHNKHSHKSWCKHSKGAKGSSNKGSDNKWWWCKGSSDKGSKGSCDKGSKGSTCVTPKEVSTTGSVCGTVYHDKNTNSRQDQGEQGVEGISIQLTDSNHAIQTISTDKLGNYCFNIVQEGPATIEVLALPPGGIFLEGENPNDIIVIADQNNSAGVDGYFIAD